MLLKAIIKLLYLLNQGDTQSRGGMRRSWIDRKIHLYNVTMGLYMLDWWERYLFNILMIVLLWFIFYNGSRSASEFYNSHLPHLKSRFFKAIMGNIPC
ncbi:hypothetical protein ZOSMA_49G00740 [Zostera marina]|uniref:Uncharacterized protein n=1 Tax=Zostera marina TaxID=29655 RepID=A0A0K9NYV0_ZOSMR|nr:hypothetical protein ZOSMA_49G00740 [Zostera marina]